MLLSFAENKYSLKLKIGELLKLEKTLKDSLGNISQRLALGNWNVSDVQAIIYLGLCGGGLTEAKAQDITDDFFDKEPFLTAVQISGELLAQSLTGAISDEPQTVKSSKKKVKDSMK